MFSYFVPNRNSCEVRSNDEGAAWPLVPAMLFSSSRYELPNPEVACINQMSVCLMPCCYCPFRSLLNLRVAVRGAFKF